MAAAGKASSGAPSTPTYLAKSETCVNAKEEYFGNGVFAGENFDIGTEVIGVRRPLVGSLDTSRLKDTCANCFTWTEGSSIGSRLYVKEGTKLQRCAGCKRYNYCSKACQKEAWNRVHKYECKNLKELIDKDFPKGVQATMEILIRRKHKLITDQEWQLLCDLETHLEDFKRSGVYDRIQLMAMGAQKYSSTQDTFPLEFIEGLYGRVLTNSLTLVTPTYDPLGLIVDEKFGKINHSCDPNAYNAMDGPGIALRALKPIKKDEEIFIAYVDTTNPYARRQTELQSRWFFTCRCKKCEKGPTLLEDKWALDISKLPEHWKQAGDTMIEQEEFATDPANYVGDSQDGKRVTAIQGKAFAYYQAAQSMEDPSGAMEVIQNGMRLCYQTGLWPVYRQPYAALRDDLIVNLLSVGNFQLAWAQCAKRYRYILPNLYPQKSHPVRVVQVWQMAMLALYLASEEGVAPGVDMGLIALMLISEVRDTCILSHGKNNSFARSVQRKYDEMIADFHEKLGPDAQTKVSSQLPHQKQLLMEMATWVQY